MTTTIEIAYRIPGKSAFVRRTFKREEQAEKFVERLVEREGSDVEVRWGAQ